MIHTSLTFDARCRPIFNGEVDGFVFVGEQSPDRDCLDIVVRSPRGREARGVVLPEFIAACVRPGDVMVLVQREAQRLVGELLEAERGCPLPAGRHDRGWPR